MIRSKLSLQLLSRQRFKAKPVKRLHIQLLHQHDVADNFEIKMGEKLDKIPEADTAEEEWSHLKEATYQAAAETVGYMKRVHRDWFDENDSWRYKHTHTHTHTHTLNDRCRRCTSAIHVSLHRQQIREWVAFWTL